MRLYCNRGAGAWRHGAPRHRCRGRAARQLFFDRTAYDRRQKAPRRARRVLSRRSRRVVVEVRRRGVTGSRKRKRHCRACRYVPPLSLVFFHPPTYPPDRPPSSLRYIPSPVFPIADHSLYSLLVKHAVTLGPPSPTTAPSVVDAGSDGPLNALAVIWTSWSSALRRTQDQREGMIPNPRGSWGCRDVGARRRHRRSTTLTVDKVGMGRKLKR
ncbi:hypothetical protein R3P38DRAFT_1293224 [Favolaschia claudopus]|uniref:Uncharacterized protein n=1 Tax=Favolaschia claudopus TaxID=2862362 RepID=A0AAW0AWQ5_9AGAR